MISLTVVSYNGAPPTVALQADFDEIGGTIGRADNNQMVLPDPDRTISRVHAQIVFRSGGYAIVDRGSNPISVNDRPVGNGHEAPLKDGDQVQIGGYLMTTRQTPTSAAAGRAFAGDQFADLLGPAPPPPAGRGRAAAAAGPVDDPFAAFGIKAGASPFADPLAMPPAPPRQVPAPAAAPVSRGIPEDWDPFAPAAPAPRSAPADLSRSLGLDVGASAPPPLISGLGGETSDNSLDKLFGLTPGFGDPLANSVLSEAAAKPNMAANADPMRSLNSAPLASSASESDTLSDLQRPFISRQVAAAPAAAPLPRAAATPPPTAPPPPSGGLPSGAVLSWQDPSADGHTVIRPPARPATAAATPAARPAPIAAPVPPAVAPTAGAPASADVQALLTAFRAGLATPSVQVDALTPELMGLIGELLRESAQGVVDLLVARAAMKREVRAEATMIVVRENNPLKFSPSADAALGHLLSPPTRGFMAAGPAMRDAYADLRAHQFGFVAGLRAALEGMLERFDPAQLEGKLTQRSVLQSILPGSRKARMWELFTEMYGQIRTEASDDFHTLFGKAFLKAYEEHIAELQSREPRP